MNSTEQRSIRKFEEKAEELLSLMYALTETGYENISVSDQWNPSRRKGRTLAASALTVDKAIKAFIAIVEL